MRFPNIMSLLVVLVLSANGVMSLAQSCTVDQSLLTWNGGTSERNLPGYYEWQSFTSGMTGTLCEVDLMFGNSNIKLNGTGTLKIYTGTGIAGSLLASQPVTVNGTAYNINTNFWQSWIVNSPPNVVAGSVYTFQFIPTVSGGLPDPYIIVVNTTNPYAGGRNSQAANFDNPFKTFVKTALPLKLLSFDGRIEGKIVRLHWTTASEVNTDYFMMERSTDAVNYISIGKIKASAKPGSNWQYSFADESVGNKICYYRLRMIDKDGSFTYSPVCKVSWQDNLKIAVYPNPAKGYLFINGSKLKAMKLIANDGKVVIQQALQETFNQINIANIATGYYTVVVYDLSGYVQTQTINTEK